MEIKRDAYLQQLIERKDNGMMPRFEEVLNSLLRMSKYFLLNADSLEF